MSTINAQLFEADLTFKKDLTVFTELYCIVVVFYGNVSIIIVENYEAASLS